VGLFTPVRDYVDSLVHPSAQADALAAARHRAFIAPRLLGGFIVIAALPVFLALRGVPTALEIAVFAWLMAPILIAYDLSRTGRFERAQILSSLALTALITIVASATGAMASFAAVWLAVVPAEAATSASRRVVAAAALFALTAASFLLALQWSGLVSYEASAAEMATFTAAGIVSAMLYATGLALGVESLVRESARRLSDEEARYRFLAENMSDAITRHGRNGAVLFASPGAEALFGTRLRDLHGHGLFDRVLVTDRPAFLTALSSAATSGAETSVEFRVRQEQPRGDDTRFIWVEMRCRPLDRGIAAHASAPDGEVVAVMRDVTARKQQEAALQDARAEAERANEAKGRFLATMSHELRTPLNAIIGFSDMLLNASDLQLDEARRQEYARLINGSGQHLLSVVNGILDMSKIESGNFEITPEPFAPDTAIRHCSDLLALKAREAGIDLVVSIAPDLPEIVADKRALKQILINLLSNAVKFTDRGGKVVLTAAGEDAHLVLSVEDSGIGIGEEDLPRLGDPFFQARGSYDRPYDGTGLGLSVVKGLVGLHGGDIEIRSRLGEGTRVVVRLPVDCEKAAARTSVTKLARRPANEGAISTVRTPVKQSA